VRTRLVNLVLLALLAFAVARFWSFVSEPPPVLPAIKPDAATPAALVKTTQKTEAVDSRPEAYDAIVARDLFSPARGVVPPAPTAAAKAAPKPQPPPKLTLYGVVIVDGEKAAYLQEGTQAGLPRKVREKENFAGGVVSAIRPDGVTFLFSGVPTNVPLRTPKDGAGTPAARSPDAAAAVPPAAFPRRQPGQLPGSRPANSPPAVMPGAMPPGDPGSEDLDNENFPGESAPGGEVPGMMEEETGE